MEVDSGTVGENRDRDGSGIDGSENVEVKIQNTPDSEPKVKRKMKTPTQLEILEKTYAVEAYPPEALRAELSVKLGLSDRQLQMWFCHRRLKDRKPPKEKQEKPEKRQKKVASSSAVEVCSGGSAPDIAAKNAFGSNHCNSGLSLFENVDLPNQHRVVHNVGIAVPRYEPPLAVSEQRAIRYVEAQLGERLREDGPILGMEFDPLPHGAFGARIVPSEKKKPAGRSYDAQPYEKLDAKPIQGATRALHEFQFLPEKPLTGNDPYERLSPPRVYHSAIDVSSARISFQSGASFSHCNEQVPSGFIISQMPVPKISGFAQQGRPAPREVDTVLTVAPVLSAGFDSPHPIHSLTGEDVQINTPEKHMVCDSERSDRKRKAEEARIAKEVESHEKKIRKELEKQNLLMKKREEQMRKEMERQIREQRKEEEKLMREKQREEERYQKEQKRELERREKFLRKEYIRAEKRRLKEEVRREKEAAKLKAANDRAAARRIAKESIELFDDERLELMELAGQTWNLLFSLRSSDFDNLDSYKDKLMDFPPKSVPLKRPFQSEPWTDSEENVGDLLMVWRFLIAFADVLGLWPFTLDEFVQALHDFDSRLLGEVHIALLRSIVNDIEEVARTSAASMAANQTSAAIPPGGHPRIVEGAYAWGFDLLSWSRLLTPLTWPEVLRQFALSAGFGPKLKKSSGKSACFHDENEGDNGADNISSIRSGVAAENAFAIMQEKGFSKPRRSQHRLTPGTVKFAAFHVLSVAGSTGLSILEVAEKIQRSGLRDLTTSKTPEASISAALSRDTKLFERTAPSTYCVRSPFRKDPSDADAVLSAAREKVRFFMSGNTDDEVAEDVEKDAAERDPDSESDIAEDPDDNVGKLTGSSHSRETSMIEDGFQHATDNCPEQLLGSFTDATGCSSSRSTLKQSIDKITINGEVALQHLQNIVADECDSGEHWVRGLTEGEYGKLSVEERLRALVALVGIANEGNAVRIALEERLEAANALKKQMWVEAQLDKRRIKDDILRLPCSTKASDRAEQNFVSEYGRTSQLRVDTRCDSQLANPRMHLIDLNDQQYDENFCSNRMEVKEESSLVSENLFEPSGYATERSRYDLKVLFSYRAEGVYTYRSSPLGLDRRHNRYWQFIASPSCSDTGSGRIFVELSNGSWRLIDSEEAFYGLLSSLDVRGIRESHLHSMLRNIETSFRDSVRRGPLHFESGIQIHHETGRNFLEGSSTPHAIATEPRGTEVTDEMLKHKALESWMWKECFDCNVLSSLKFGILRRPRLLEICDSCYALVSPSFGWLCSCSDKGFDISGDDSHSKMEHREEFSAAFAPNLSLPPRTKFLKAQLSTIEASIPSESFDVRWLDDVRSSFALKLLMASTAEELLQSIAMLECSIKRDSFSPSFIPTSELSSSKAGERSYTLGSSSSEAIPVLPWIPLTAAAVSLRLMEMDSAIYYTPEQKESRKTDNETGFFSKYSSVCSSLGIYVNDAAQDGTLRQNGSSFDLANQGFSSRRGRGTATGS